MSANKDYGNIFCEAVSTLVKQQLNEAQNFDITKDCYIVGVKNKHKGRYDVSDGSMIFEAFATTGATYSLGDQVLVTIPNGDYSKQKTILNLIITEKVDAIGYVSPLDNFIKGTGNIIQYKDSVGVIANEEIKVGADGESLQGYLKNIWSLNNEKKYFGFTRVAIQADFMTMLPENVMKGEYGLKLIITGINNNNVENVAELTFASHEMLGNIYSFNTYFQQEVVFTIPSHIKTITNIQLYLYQDSQFYDGNQTRLEVSDVPNIFVKNIKMYLGYQGDYTSQELVQIATDNLSFNDKAVNKELVLTWLHKIDEGVFEPINQNNFNSSIHEIRWYQYIAGCPKENTDEYGGQNWKLLPAQDTRDYPFIRTVKLNPYRTEEKFKAIALIKTHPLHNNPIYFELHNYDSNVLIFENDETTTSGGITSEEQVKQDLSLHFNDNSYGNYFIYDQNGIIIDGANNGVNKLRTISIHYKGEELGSNNDRYGQIEFIKWEYSKGNTMINHTNSSDQSEKEVSFTYSILDNWNQSRNNNIIKCSIKFKDTLQTFVLIENLRFGIKGTSGTSNTFILEMLDGKNALVLGSDDVLRVKALLCNTNGKLVSLDEINISWEIINNKYINLSETTSSIVELKLNEICENIPDDNYAILQASCQYIEDSASGTNPTLKAFLPIPIKNQDCLSMSGPDRIIYNHLGQPKYGENPYEIHLLKNNFIDKDISKWVITSNPNPQIHIENYDDYLLVYENECKTDGPQEITPTKITQELTLNKGKYKLSFKRWLFGYVNDSGLTNGSLNYCINDKLIEVDWGKASVNGHLSSQSCEFTVENDNETVSISFESNYIMWLKDIKVEFFGWKCTNKKNTPNPINLNDNNTLQATPLYSTTMEENQSDIQDGACICCEGFWSQPILIMQSHYDFAMLNSWNGNLTIDQKNGTILSTMLGAGKKNSKNEFSGVLIGDVQGGTGLIDTTPLTGVYGFKDGVMTYGLKENGTAFFGAQDEGRIEFDGASGIIRSAGWINKDGWKLNPAIGQPDYDPSVPVKTTGTLIDLDDGKLLMEAGTNYFRFENGYLNMQLSGSNIYLTDQNNNFSSYIEATADRITTEIRQKSGYKCIPTKLEADWMNNLHYQLAPNNTEEISAENLLKQNSVISIDFKEYENDSALEIWLQFNTEDENNGWHAVFLNGKVVSSTNPLTWVKGATLYFKYNENEFYGQHKGTWHVVDGGSYSKITQTANSIKSEVSNGFEQVRSEISQTANEIKAEAVSKEGGGEGFRWSLTADGFTLDSMQNTSTFSTVFNCNHDGLIIKPKTFSLESSGSWPNGKIVINSNPSSTSQTDSQYYLAIGKSKGGSEPFGSSDEHYLTFKADGKFELKTPSLWIKPNGTAQFGGTLSAVSGTFTKLTTGSFTINDKSYTSTFTSNYIELCASWIDNTADQNTVAGKLYIGRPDVEKYYWEDISIIAEPIQEYQTHTSGDYTSYGNVGTEISPFDLIYARSHLNGSARKLKENILTYNINQAYEELKYLPIYTYHYKSDTNKTKMLKLGTMIDYLPNEVMATKTETNQVYDRDNLVFWNIAATKTLQSKFEDLALKVDSLEQCIINWEGK